MNSNCRSARRSSSRKQRAIWKYFSKPDDHQDLLEELRRLRQRVPLAAVDARGHEEVARALGRRAGQHRRLDLEEPPLVEGLPDPERDLVAQDQVLLHRRPAQVEVAVLEAQLLGRVGAVLDRRRAASPSAPGTRGARRRPRPLPSAVAGCAGPRPAGRPRPRSRRRPRCRASAAASTASAGQRARSKTTCTMPLRSRTVRKMSSPRSRRRADPALAAARPGPRRRRAAPRPAAARASSLPPRAEPLGELARGNVSCSPVARSFTVTVLSLPLARSHEHGERAAAAIEAQLSPARLEESLARSAMPFAKPRPVRSVSTTASRPQPADLARRRRRARRQILGLPGRDHRQAPARPRTSAGIASTRRSSPIANPTAGVGGPPSVGDELVVAAAAEDRVLRAEAFARRPRTRSACSSRGPARSRRSR